MGWKQVKDHYRIEHIVQVTEEGVCIGSPYIHNLIVIGMDGAIKKEDDGRVNEELKRYMAEFKSDLPWLRELVTSPDTFAKSIPVYTYEGCEIIEKKCEKLGWPNVTHDGCLQYGNTFSSDKNKVVKWAKREAALIIESYDERIEQVKKDLAKHESEMIEWKNNLAKLEKDYP